MNASSNQMEHNGVIYDVSDFRAKVVSAYNHVNRERGWTIMIQAARGLRYNLPFSQGDGKLYFTEDKKEASVLCKEQNQYFQSLTQNR